MRLVVPAAVPVGRAGGVLAGHGSAVLVGRVASNDMGVIGMNVSVTRRVSRGGGPVFR